ncbi:MAG: hypothetical protein NVS3B16_23270 [Vulcanimicrobiaceae bacterium]
MFAAVDRGIGHATSEGIDERRKRFWETMLLTYRRATGRSEKRARHSHKKSLQALAGRAARSDGGETYFKSRRGYR